MQWLGRAMVAVAVRGSGPPELKTTGDRQLHSPSGPLSVAQAAAGLS
jgi:hypothetical protein